MDYKFYSILKKNKTLFFVKTSYPNFEYVNPNDYITILENIDFSNIPVIPDSIIINTAYDSFVLKDCSITEYILESSLINGKSVLHYKLEIPDNYYVSKFSSHRVNSVNFLKNDKQSIINLYFDNNFNINELQSSDTISLDYKYISHIESNKYPKTININKNFLNDIHSNISDFTKTIKRNINNNLSLVVSGFIKPIGIKDDEINNIEFQLNKDVNYINISLLKAQKPKFINKHDSINNLGFYANKSTSINVVSLVSSRDLIST